MKFINLILFFHILINNNQFTKITCFLTYTLPISISSLHDTLFTLSKLKYTNILTACKHLRNYNLYALKCLIRCRSL